MSDTRYAYVVRIGYDDGETTDVPMRSRHAAVGIAVLLRRQFEGDYSIHTTTVDADARLAGLSSEAAGEGDDR